MAYDQEERVCSRCLQMPGLCRCASASALYAQYLDRFWVIYLGVPLHLIPLPLPPEQVVIAHGMYDQAWRRADLPLVADLQEVLLLDIEIPTLPWGVL